MMQSKVVLGEQTDSSNTPKTEVKTADKIKKGNETTDEAKIRLTKSLSNK
jgi:hypothetical protein